MKDKDLNWSLEGSITEMSCSAPRGYQVLQLKVGQHQTCFNVMVPASRASH